MVVPVKVPRLVVFSATPDSVIRSSTLPSISVTTEVAALVSTDVSKAWRACLTVWLSGIVVPVKVPRFVDAAATPESVIRLFCRVVTVERSPSISLMAPCTVTAAMVPAGVLVI